MARLSDFQLACLLEEIGSSMQHGVPIADSMRRLENRRLGRIAHVAAGIRQGLNRGESVSEAVSQTASSFSPQAGAAMEICERNGDPRLLLRMASHLRRRAEEMRDRRLAWFYPWILLALGYCVGVFSLAPVVLDAQSTEFHWDPWVVASAGWLSLNWWIPPLVATIALAMFLVWRLSRNRLPKVVRYALFCNTLSDQFKHGVAEDAAIRSAAMLSGDAELITIENPSLESPLIASLLASVNPLEESVTPNKNHDLVVAKLRYLGSNFELISRRRTYLISHLAPQVAVFVIGGGLTLLYVMCIIAPAYQEVMRW